MRIYICVFECCGYDLVQSVGGRFLGRIYSCSCKSRHCEAENGSRVRDIAGSDC